MVHPYEHMVYVPEKIKVWKRGGFRLTLWDMHQTGWDGKPVLKYRFLDQGKVIFQGEDFRCGMGTAIDSLACVYSLLGLLSCMPGDTEADFFAKYTPEQLTWSKSGRAELLGLFVYDFENRRK